MTKLFLTTLLLIVLNKSAFALDSSSISPLNVTTMNPTATAQASSQTSSTTIDVCRAIYDGSATTSNGFRVTSGFIYINGVKAARLNYDPVGKTCMGFVPTSVTYALYATINKTLYIKLSHDGVKVRNGNYLNNQWGSTVLWAK